MTRKELGIAVVGAGRIGALRARLAAKHPSVRFLAVSDIDPSRARALAEQAGAQVHSGDNDEVINLGVSYALPAKYPTLGQSDRVELLGTEGTMLIDDDHMDQLLYSEKGIPHAYVPGHSVNMAFLGSNTAGDWAAGDSGGRSRTRADAAPARWRARHSTGSASRRARSQRRSR